MLKSSSELFKVFDKIGISYVNHDHEPTFTVEQSKSLKNHIPGAHTKNLFLYNKKEEYFLITLLNDKQLNMKAFQDDFQRGRLSFASPQRLMACLGVEPGSVTPFGVINDTVHQVKVILDAEMMECPLLNHHPLQNRMTVSLSTPDFRKFLEYTGHVPDIRVLPKI